ncbi:MAG: segregation and condensation protein A [Propionibacteriaceae bacterium]
MISPRRAGGDGASVPTVASSPRVPGTRTDPATAFSVSLDNFSGPFDLLLQLISRHKMDITEVSLSRVTDEFIGHIKRAQSISGGPTWDLDQTSQFIVVAATLLDLKAARLLPSGEVDDPEDLALLEARDLLFARLLQYRAFKQIAAYLGSTLDAQARRFPRQVPMEPRFARLLPELTMTQTPGDLAALAARALAPKDAAVVSLTHLHAPTVSVAEQAMIVVDRLRRARTLTFRALTGDSPNRLTTVARFLALLELFRSGSVAFDQLTPLGELTVRWTGSDDGELEISEEFDTGPDTGSSAQPEPTDPQEDRGDAARD